MTEVPLCPPPEMPEVSFRSLKKAMKGSEVCGGPCRWCATRDRSSGQACFQQFAHCEQERGESVDRMIVYGNVCVVRRNEFANVTLNEEYFKDYAVFRQDYWRTRTTGVSYFAECDAQYLEEQK